MYNRLTIWLCNKATKIESKDKYFKIKIFHFLWQSFLFAIADLIHDIVKFILNIKAQLLWQKQKINSKFTKNEFDESLSLDTEIVFNLNPKHRDKYRKDLINRRRISHLEDLGNLSPGEKMELKSRKKGQVVDGPLRGRNIDQELDEMLKHW